jgi:hypothetical protein
VGENKDSVWKLKQYLGKFSLIKSNMHSGKQRRQSFNLEFGQIKCNAKLMIYKSEN